MKLKKRIYFSSIQNGVLILRNPKVDKVKRLYDGKPINGIIVHFHEINGEEEEDKMNEFEKRHNVSIDGYPSIYLVKGDQVIEYDANPTRDSITEFLNTAL
jgi:hypothetical protein